MSKKRLQYAYDAVGNRSLLVDPDGGWFTYAYDSLNRISHLENPQNERTTYAYDDNGRRTVKKLANGTRASFTYDDANNLTRLANLKSDGTTISSFNYAYDKTGNRTAVLEADGSRVTWSYDDTYQLTGEHRTGSNAYRSTFTYDPAGNRTLKNESGQRTTYAYDAANQLKTAQAALGTTTYTFDADGNQQIVQPPTGPRTTTTWDYENRTTLVELASGLRNTMAYEPDGLRVKLEDSTGTKKFNLAETDDTDTTQVVYTNEPRRYGHLISQRRNSTTNWYHFDALSSTRDLTLASEAVSDTYLYDAWGVPIASTGAPANPFQFVGKLGYYCDVDSGADYVRARVYQPLTARWTATDSITIRDSHNLYLYVLNAPVIHTDASGLQAGDDILWNAPKCCSGGSIKITQLSCRYAQGDLGVPFQITVSYKRPHCTCCEYRQFIYQTLERVELWDDGTVESIVNDVRGTRGRPGEEDNFVLDTRSGRTIGTRPVMPNVSGAYTDAGCSFHASDIPGFDDFATRARGIGQRHCDQNPGLELVALRVVSKFAAFIVDACNPIANQTPLLSPRVLRETKTEWETKCTVLFNCEEGSVSIVDANGDDEVLDRFAF